MTAGDHEAYLVLLIFGSLSLLAAGIVGLFFIRKISQFWSVVVFLALSVLSGCASAPPTVEVKVPVGIACGSTPAGLDTPPDTKEALQAAPDIFERVKLLLAGRYIRMANEGKLRAALAGCDALPQSGDGGRGKD